MSRQQVAWEANDVFNPAATVKMVRYMVLYRSGQIRQGVDVLELGIAESTDGIRMKEDQRRFSIH